MEREDLTWLQRQVLNYPTHWSLSITFFGIIYWFCYNFIGVNIGDAATIAFFGMMSYATVAELNQHIIKIEHGVTLVDVLDAVFDWASWVFFPGLLIGAVIG